MKSARTPYLAYSFQVRNASCQPPLVPKLSGTTSEMVQPLLGISLTLPYTEARIG